MIALFIFVNYSRLSALLLSITAARGWTTPSCSAVLVYCYAALADSYTFLRPFWHFRMAGKDEHDRLKRTLI